MRYIGLRPVTVLKKKIVVENKSNVGKGFVYDVLGSYKESNDSVVVELDFGFCDKWFRSGAQLGKGIIKVKKRCL